MPRRGRIHHSQAATQTTRPEAVPSPYDPNALLWLALAKNDLFLLRKVIQEGASVNTPNAAGTPPLVIACSMGSAETIHLLVEGGANVDVLNDSHQTPLMLAVTLNRPDIMAELIRHGTNVNAISSYGETALMNAAYQGNEHSIALLLGARAQVNTTNSSGSTALMYAVQRGHGKIVAQLIVQGARLDTVNRKGESAAMLAVRWGHPHLAALLQDHADGRQNGAILAYLFEPPERQHTTHGRRQFPHPLPAVHANQGPSPETHIRLDSSSRQGHALTNTLPALPTISRSALSLAPIPEMAPELSKPAPDTSADASLPGQPALFQDRPGNTEP